METYKIQMHQKRKNLKSTKPQEPKRQEETSMQPLAKFTQAVFTNIVDLKRQISTYPKGKLPVTSNRFNKYLFVLYNHARNIILSSPMKSMTDSKFVWFFKELHAHILTSVLNTAYMRLENEASPAFQRELQAQDIKFQLAPPGLDCRNADEHAIIKLKYHIVAGSCSIDPDLPMKNCDCLLEQKKITFNLIYL